jgi:hypothetical protein
VIVTVSSKKALFEATNRPSPANVPSAKSVVLQKVAKPAEAPVKIASPVKRKSLQDDESDADDDVIAGPKRRRKMIDESYVAASDESEGEPDDEALSEEERDAFEIRALKVLNGGLESEIVTDFDEQET